MGGPRRPGKKLGHRSNTPRMPFKKLTIDDVAILLSETDQHYRENEVPLAEIANDIRTGRAKTALARAKRMWNRGGL